MHALNHIFKTRDRILKNTAKLHAAKEDSEELELRDQGFTRPKVLIMLPTRDACYEVVEQLIKLSGTEQQENKRNSMTNFMSRQHHQLLNLKILEMLLKVTIMIFSVLV